MPHLLLLEPRRRVGRIRDGDKAVVVRTVNVIHPGVSGRYLMERIVRSGRKLGVVGINYADSEDAGRSPPVPLFLVQPRLILPCHSAAPCDAAFAEEHRN